MLSLFPIKLVKLKKKLTCTEINLFEDKRQSGTMEYFNKPKSMAHVC